MADISAKSTAGTTVPDADASFWDVNQYRRVLKRMEKGINSCDVYSQMLKERAAAETAYSAALNKWADKWSKHHEKSPDHGSTLQAGLDGFTVQAKSCAEFHSKVGVELIAIADEDLLTYKKYAYHKEFIGWKEIKIAEKGFIKAQKPWVKSLETVNKCQQKYHQGCTNESNATEALKAAEGDSSFTIAQTNKLRAKLEKSTQDKQANLRKYEKSLDDNQTYLPRYKADMTSEYMRCQDIEAARIDKVKEVVLKAYLCLSVIDAPGFNDHFYELNKKLNTIDSSVDLQDYDRNHGVGMPDSYPVYTEWAPDMALAPVTTSNTATHDNSDINGGGVYHTQTNQTPVSDDRPRSVYNDEGGYAASADDFGSFEDPPDQHYEEQHYEEQHYDQQYDYPAASAPAYNAAFDGSGGQLYISLYDYSPDAKDELPLTEGEHITVISEVNDGWCLARNSAGSEGQVPANYLEIAG